MKQCLHTLRKIKFGVNIQIPVSCVRRKNSTFHVTAENVFSDEHKTFSQEKMSKLKPVYKLKGLKKIPNKAAVLVPFCTVNGEPSVLFSVRSNQLYTHRGEVSFPGGRLDKSDADLVHTALRETEEELGLLPDRIDVWGELKPLPSKDFKNIVTPVVGYCGEIDVTELRINQEEVESVFTSTIQSLNTNAASTRFRSPNDKISHARFGGGGGYTMPVYLVGEHRIWGLTAVFLHQVLSVVAGDLYKFKLKH